MEKVLCFDDYARIDEFYQMIGNCILNESVTDDFKTKQSIYKDALESFKTTYAKAFSLNLGFIGKFSTAITVFCPIIEKLMKGQNISYDVTSPTTIIMIAIASITIIVSTEKNKYGNTHDMCVKISKSIIEELKMRGVGEGLVKKSVKILELIKKLFMKIGRCVSLLIFELGEMFAYTALMIPIMNAIFSFVGKYSFTFDTCIFNLKTFIFGVATLGAKYLIKTIIAKIKANKSLSNNKVDKIEQELDTDDTEDGGENIVDTPMDGMPPDVAIV